MDKRFTEIRPNIHFYQTLEIEPPLFDLIEHYYISQSVEPTKAKKLAKRYIKAWIADERESSNASLTGGYAAQERNHDDK